MDLHRPADGRFFLESLIQRGMAILSTMLQMLNQSQVSLKQQINMINSVYRFVETWENVLPAISSLEVERNLIDLTVDSNAAVIEPKQNNLALVADYQSTTSKIVEAKMPEFEFPVVAYDRYQPGQIGICDITYICKTEAEFYMIDQSATGINFAEILQTLQNVDTVLEDLPESSTHVFGVRVEGAIFRAIRSKQSDQPFVKLLDTGEILVFDDSRMSLLELPPFYAKLSPFAVKCSLANVEGCATINDYRKYLDENLYNRLGYKVLNVNESWLEVSLMSLACVEKPRLIKEEKLEQEHYKVSLDTLTQAQLDELYEEPLNTTNVMKAVLGYVPKDDKRICPFYDPAVQGCFKGSRCRLEHVAKLSDGWTRDKSLYKIQIRAELETPVVGTEMLVIPTFIVNVDEFYAHIPRQDLSKGLIELQVKMNDDKIMENYRVLNHEPHFRELVFAKYSEDDLWYRARVVEFYNPELITVFYVDYGNTAVVSLKDLRCWDDQFDYLPFQAVHCRIANAQRLRDDHTEAIRQMFKDIINKVMKIQILDNLSPWEVLLFDDEDNDIGQFLVLTKLALPRVPLVMDKRGTNFIPG